MAHILFYEKPGCINNTKQKTWLKAAGHDVEAVNLLEPGLNALLQGGLAKRNPPNKKNPLRIYPTFDVGRSMFDVHSPLSLLLCFLKRQL